MSSRPRPRHVRRHERLPRKRARSLSSRRMPWCWSPRPRSITGSDPGTPGERYQVVVHVDADVLADAEAPGQSVVEGGARVSAETSQRLACDASRVEMRHDADGVIVEVSARTRTIPTALRRALVYRDHGCCFPGCDLPFGQAHPINHVGSGRAHDPAESRPAMPPASSRGSRRRLPGRPPGEWRAAIPLAERRCAARMSRRRRRRPTTRRQMFGPGTPRRDISPPAHGQHQSGTGNPWTSAGRSTFYIPWPPVTDTASPPAGARRSSA